MIGRLTTVVISKIEGGATAWDDEGLVTGETSVALTERSYLEF